MPEKDIPSDQILTYAGNKKDPTLCRVKHCRTKRLGDRRVCSKHNMELWRRRNPARAAFEIIKARAKQRKQGFTLTFDEFKQIAEATGYIM